MQQVNKYRSPKCRLKHTFVDFCTLIALECAKLLQEYAGI